MYCNASDTVLRTFMSFFTATECEILSIGTKLPIPKFDVDLIRCLIKETADSLISNSSPLIEIEGENYYVVGDIHGNLTDLIRIISFIYQRNDEIKIIFLGDYIDRGAFSLECVLLLFSLTTQYPQNVFLLRGNHEFLEGKSEHPIIKELEEFYGQENSAPIFESIMSAFSWLPFGILYNNKFLCIHGGLSPLFNKVSDLNNIQLPVTEFTAENQIIKDILWSDPCNNVSNFVESPRGSGYLFGRLILENFLYKNKLRYIIRGHQCVSKGIEMAIDGIVTVFSSSYYSQEENLGGFILIDKDDKIRMFHLKPFRHVERKLSTFCEVASLSSQPRIRTISMSSNKLPPLFTSARSLLQPSPEQQAVAATKRQALTLRKRKRGSMCIFDLKLKATLAQNNQREKSTILLDV